MFSPPSVFSFTELRSPTRKRPVVFPSPKSPFCTSPSQLQEVTLDQDASAFHSVGMRSPGGTMRGRSVKEIEEQMANLRKENFNLKLRIYFLEERMGPSFNLDEENAVKKNIELMVELESLKKEVQEKQELLCEAVKAMELEEEEHRKDTESKDKELGDVKQKYTLLHQQFEVIQEEVRSQGDHVSVDLARDYYEFAENSSASKDIIKQLESRIVDLETQLMSEKSTVNRLNNLIEYPGDNKELREALSEKEEKLEDCLLDLEEKCQELSDAVLKIEAMEVELQDKRNELEMMEKDRKQRDAEVSDLQAELQLVNGLYQDTKSMYEHEIKKNEKSKVAIVNRNAKISELEASLDKYRTTVGDLEVKLQTAQNEVKSKPLEPQTLRGPRRKAPHTDIDSFSVQSSPSIAEHSPKSLLRSFSSPTSRRTPNSSKQQEDESMSPEDIGTELSTSKQRIAKLEQDQMKACRIIQTMLESRKKNGREIEELQRNLHKRDLQIQELKEKLSASTDTKEKKSLQTKISEMNLTAAAPTSDSEHTMDDAKGDTLELLDQYKALTQELDTQKQILLDTLKEKDVQMEALQTKYTLLLDDVKVRDNRIVDLEFELLSGKDQKEKTDSGSEKVSFWIRETEEKDKEIERLEKELSRKTCDLQTVVNKELWEKNREIEKLQKKFGALFERKDAEINDLKKDISYKEDKLRVLKERIDDAERKEGGYKVDMLKLQEKIGVCLDDRKKLLAQLEELKLKITTLSADEVKVSKLKDELLKSETLRTETNEICNVLSLRLEELALFLDSLLRQKSVLGFLGNRQNNRLRQFIDHSLDLSRSLNMSLTMNPDQSLMQLTNISELLNSTRAESLCVEQFLKEDKEELSIIPDHVTLTYQSHLNVKNADKLEEQAEIIKVLRNQVENLKHEIEVRDIEIANKLALNSEQEVVNSILDMDMKTKSVISPEKILENLMSDRFKFNMPGEKNANDNNKTSATIKCHDSDSESWSEPDRSVSKARIGLQDNESIKPKVKSCVQSESTELELSRSSLSKTPSKKSNLVENKQVVNALIQQITELQERLKNKENELSQLQCIHTDIIEKYETMENKYKEEKTKYNEIITSHELFLKKIVEIEANLNDAERRSKIAEDRVEELQRMVAELQENKRALLESMDSKSKAVQDKVNALECERNRAEAEKRLAEEELDAAREQIRMTEMRLVGVEKEMVEMESKYKSNCDCRIKNIEEEYELKIKQIENNAESKIKLITASSNELMEKVETEYVKKNEMDHLVNMLSELETLKEVLKVSENRVRSLEESEVNLKSKLQETETHYREKLVELRKELDNSTLQFSEAVLQKTKIVEQKLQLEHEMKVYREKEEDFVKQVSELKEEFANLKEKFQKQLSSMENQKSKLLVRISELENCNADLLNKLIKRVTRYDEGHAKSAPNSPTSKILNLYLSRNPETNLRKDSDTSTGFISESHTVSFVNFRNISADDARHADLDRQHANSSPDLGIESDHGRFSSLEANVNVPRPYLQSLELSQSMNQMLDKEQSQLVACANEQCCVKSEENAQLRKKLLKSNKLLEETIKKLAKANERKREVERNICNQITKTSQVLRKAKANLDSGSECELRK